LIEKDKALFKTDIDNYRKILNHHRRACDEPEGSVVNDQKENKEDLYKRKFVINPENFKSITYKYNDKFLNTGPKKEKETINL